jgi:hypothetical protein
LPGSLDVISWRDFKGQQPDLARQGAGLLYGQEHVLCRDATTDGGCATVEIIRSPPLRRRSSDLVRGRRPPDYFDGHLEFSGRLG